MTMKFDESPNRNDYIFLMGFGTQIWGGLARLLDSSFQWLLLGYLNFSDGLDVYPGFFYARG